MSLSAPLALLLLAALPVLLLLAASRAATRRREVGTLLIWRRVASQVELQQRRRRSIEPLLWLLLAAAALAAAAAARPVLSAAAEAPRVAVYIERLDPGDEPYLDDIRERARQAAPGAELTFFMAAPAPVGFRPLHPGAVQAELAQFMARSDDFDGRMCFLTEPEPAPALVLPRLTAPRAGVVYEVAGDRASAIVRFSAGPAPVTDAPVISRQAGVLVLRPDGDAATVGGISLKRERLVVGVGPDWRTSSHQGLYAALLADTADQQPAVWLGAIEQRPAIRILAGQPAETGPPAFDPSHPLFHDLPVDTVGWGARVLPPADDARVLLTSDAGDLVRLRDDGRLLEFAGDPFTDSPVAVSALLLDNAIGVLTGRRASERGGWQAETPLPTVRAAHAAPFEAQGDLDLSSRAGAGRELAAWPAALAALLLLAAAWLAAQGSPDQRPRRSRRA